LFFYQCNFVNYFISSTHVSITNIKLGITFMSVSEIDFKINAYEFNYIVILMTNWFKYDKIKIIKYLIGFNKILIKVNLTIWNIQNSQLRVLKISIINHKINNYYIQHKNYWQE